MSSAVHKDQADIEELYFNLLDRWNNRDADGFATYFTKDGKCIGFDGSQLNGQTAIATELRRIFTDHNTNFFVGIIRDVCFLSPTIALLHAVASTMPRNTKQINPDTNAIQSLIAVQENSQWSIVLYQNTPAQFHGRPDLAQDLTNELQQQVQ